MRRTHFERWRPTCLACRASGRNPAGLELSRVLREDGDVVLEGILHCSATMCRREYPIIDGIPILVLDPRGYIQSQIGDIRARHDLSHEIETLLGDCAGPDSAFESSRYHLSLYGYGHWGDMRADAPAPREGLLVSVLERGLELLENEPSGSWLDLGCSVGRGTFELARRTGSLTLGVDLNFSMVRMAQHIARTGRVSYALRRAGLVYDRCEHTLELEGSDLADFWVADVAALPLTDDAFDGALSLNVLDCVSSPVGHLMEVGRVTRSGATAIISSPYDWSSATPLEGWIGGHSQRSEHRGSSPALLRHILAGEEPALTIVAEADDVPWKVRVQERAEMSYRAHLIAARAT